MRNMESIRPVGGIHLDVERQSKIVPALVRTNLLRYRPHHVFGVKGKHGSRSAAKVHTSLILGIKTDVVGFKLF